jgi:Tfp pilus assembly protein PilV
MNDMKHILKQLKEKIRAKAHKGFTLIETFVAITILLTAITGPLTIAAQGLRSVSIAQDQTVALFLAQDAIEYVRWVRDTNRLSGNGWLANLDNCASADGAKTCFFDSRSAPSTSAIAQCPTGGCPVMRWDASNKFYNYDTVSTDNAQSKYTRTVSLIYPLCNAAGDICNTSEAAVAVGVTWQNGTITRSFTERENIFYWQPGGNEN